MEAPPPPKPPTPEERAKTFSPPEFSAPFEKTAQDGDGKWVPVVEAGEVHGAPVMYRSEVHPHGVRKDPHVTVVAMDLERVAIRLVPGTDEPDNFWKKWVHRRGLVPEEDRDALIAVFNGGFQTAHGRWGVMIDGIGFVKARKEGCVVALNEDDSVTIGPWPDVEPTRDRMRSFRQTPPCLLTAGELHPNLAHGWTSTSWAMAQGGKADIRRSALGTEPTGRILYFGLGEWVTARQIAFAMKVAGARDAAQLDVNWIWTRFVFFGRPAPDKPLQVTATLIPKIHHSKRGYVRIPSGRDFFYVVRKD